MNQKESVGRRVAMKFPNLNRLRGIFKRKTYSGKECFDNAVKQFENNLSKDPENMNRIASLISKILPKYLTDSNYTKFFQFWEQHGFHITPNHFYQPIPDTRTLKDELWTRESELIGLDLNIDVQVNFLRTVFPKFKHEYDAFPDKPTNNPHEFYLNNGYFDGFDAYVLHCMIRYFKPQRIIECGSGFSTFVSAKAALLNANTELICIEPYPSEILKKGFPGLPYLYQEKIENININMFIELQEGDILFIDTSHVVKIGGDVNTIYLEIIPRLNSGVIVHIHDIFFPWEYPRSWVLQIQRFWTEQYLLQSFLAFNSEFEILFSNSYMEHKYPFEMKSTFPNSPCGGSSFWMRRKKHSA